MNDRSYLFNDEPDDTPDDQADTIAAQWEEVFSKLPEEYRRDPDRLIADFHAIQAKVRELEGYGDWYKDYLGWKATFDEASYGAYLESRERAQPITLAPQATPPGPPMLLSTAAPAAPTALPLGDPVWLWSDLEADAPDEPEVDTVGPQEPTEPDVQEMGRSDVPPPVEDTRPVVTEVHKEPTEPDWRWHASLRCWYAWRECITGIFRWLR